MACCFSVSSVARIALADASLIFQHPCLLETVHGLRQPIGLTSLCIRRICRVLRSDLIQSLDTCFEDPVIENRENDIDLVALLQEITARLDRLSPCLIQWVSEDACRDERESDGGAAVLYRQLQRASIGSI